MKSYNDIAKEVLRRRDEQIALAAKKRAAAVKCGSVIACFCVVAISGFFAVNNSYITKSVVDTPTDSVTFNTVDPESGDDPISAYVTTESNTLPDPESVSTDESSDVQSESNDTSDTTPPQTDPVTIAPPVTRPEPPVPDTPGTAEPPSTKPEPPETTDPPTSDTEPPETTPGTTEPPSTKPEPPVTNEPTPNDTEPPVTGDTGDYNPPDTDMWPNDTAPEPNDTAPPTFDTAPNDTEPNDTDVEPPVTGSPANPPSRPEDPTPPNFWDPSFGDGGFSDVGGSMMGTASVDYITKADLFYILYFYYSHDFVTEEPIFEDVPMGRWYSESITWAAKKGIVYSVPSNNGPYLDPFDYVKRQDLACYLYALVGSPEVIGSIEDYPDFEKVEDYAVTAMAWCIENGILTDIGGELSPLSKVTLSKFKIMFDKFWYIR